MCVGTATLPCGDAKNLAGLEAEDEDEEDEDEEDEDDEEKEEGDLKDLAAARAAATATAMLSATRAACACAFGEPAEAEAAGDLCFLPSAGMSRMSGVGSAAVSVGGRETQIFSRWRGNGTEASKEARRNAKKQRIVPKV
jgi:hypothetical protein